MPVRVWQNLMEQQYPNSGFVQLRRDVLDRLYAYKRGHALATWEETIERLLNPPGEVQANAPKPLQVFT